MQSDEMALYGWSERDTEMYNIRNKLHFINFMNHSLFLFKNKRIE